MLVRNPAPWRRVRTEHHKEETKRDQIPHSAGANSVFLLRPIQPPSRAAWEHQASHQDMKRGYLGLMVHQPKLLAGYFSALAAIRFPAIPVPPALHRATDSTTAD